MERSRQQWQWLADEVARTLKDERERDPLRRRRRKLAADLLEAVRAEARRDEYEALRSCLRRRHAARIAGETVGPIDEAAVTVARLDVLVRRVLAGETARLNPELESMLEGLSRKRTALNVADTFAEQLAFDHDTDAIDPDAELAIADGRGIDLESWQRERRRRQEK